MKALVTGATGFIGRSLVEKLIQRGDQVRVLTRRPCSELQQQGVEIVQADLQQKNQVEEACQGIECVFHVAALTGVWGKWADFYQTNVTGTSNVISGCQRYGVPKLVYTSSPSVVFDQKDQANIDETTPYPDHYLCFYPQTKAIAEKMVLAANGSNNLYTTALRPHLVIGPGDPHLIPRLIERARKGRLRIIGEGTNRVDLTYIDNVVHAHLLAAEKLFSSSPVAGEAFFISQGEPVLLWEWINQLLAKINLPAIKKSISLHKATRIGAILERLYQFLRLPGEPPMTRFVAAQMGTSHYFSLAKAENLLHYRPVVSLSEGTERLAAYFSSSQN